MDLEEISNKIKQVIEDFSKVYPWLTEIDYSNKKFLQFIKLEFKKDGLNFSDFSDFTDRNYLWAGYIAAKCLAFKSEEKEMPEN